MNRAQAAPIYLVAIAVAVILGVPLALSIFVEKKTVDDAGRLQVFRDTLTGCEYLARADRGGLTPRLNAKGDHICRKGEK